VDPEQVAGSAPVMQAEPEEVGDTNVSGERRYEDMVCESRTRVM